MIAWDAALDGTWIGVLAAGSELLRLRLVIEGGAVSLASLEQGRR